MECLWNRGSRSTKLHPSAKIEGRKTRSENANAEEMVQTEEYQEDDGGDG